MQIHNTGLWSRKIGDNPPQCVDERNNLIVSPERAYFYGIRTFGGYYAISEDGILYVPQLDMYDL